MKPTRLRVEYLNNPLGIDVIEPRITWTLDGMGIKKQSSYEIKYSVNGMEQNIIHVDSSSMNHILTANFKSRDYVTFRVRVNDENNIPSDWSDESYFSIGLLSKDDWKASWIRGDYHASKKKRYPVDCFRKAFNTDSVVKATLYVSALGLYEASINGKKVGTYVLTPGSTDPRKRAQYDAYDVLNYLNRGKNEISFFLSDGWYRGSIGAKGFTCVFGKETLLIAQLELTDDKGNVTYICSDSSFEWSNDGPLRFADLKDGEIVDNRLTPSYKGHAVAVKKEVLLSSSNNVHVEENLFSKPIEVTKSKTGKKIYKFKNNVAGYIKFSVNAKAGDTLHFVMGEMLDENGDVTLHNVQCVRKGKKSPLQEVTFICKDGFNEYKTRFYYGGFQYVSLESGVQDVDIEQVAIWSSIEETSTFECSNELINIFHENTLRSLKSNSVDIPTDCPTRERMGWTGDSQVFFETASYLTDYSAFARKHLRDVFDRQDKNGRLPQIAPYSAEDWFMDVMNGSVGWADVGVLIPWRFYEKYGDIRILRDNYDGMIRYVKFMINRCGRAKGLYAIYAKPLHLSKENKKYGVNTGQSYGEWAEPSDVKSFVWTDFACPHPEESMAYTSYILGLMVEISKILGKNENIPLLEEYSNGVKKAYQELVTKPEHTLDTDRQAKLVRPLYMNLLTPEQTEFAKKRLITALDNYKWKLGTGFLSTPFILYVLQDLNPEYAYRLLENEEMPGWLYMAKNNTGTIWEGWEGPKAQLGISSLNHYSKGAVVEWFYKGMCGINVIGENRFLIKPIVGGKETYASASYQSAYGLVKSSWKKDGDKVVYSIEIPPNTSAVIELPDGRHEVTCGKYTF